MASHRALGLTDDEAAAIAAALGREPNPLELAMYAVMWSEHCSYKSSRVHLRRLPTEAPHVLVGPGENAGVIDAGGGVAVALRIESHNHPSAIEPYQGAATGVGGILRDIFTMGARPIALMDSLRLGPLEDAHSRRLFDGIVRGISGYGNSVGVPTVGGEIAFDRGHATNPLVNVLCVGLLPRSRLVLARASGVGNLAVLLGSTTGRDGIGGVSVLASSELADEGEAKRPSVQVGDPFCEKRLIEACLELLDLGLLVGLGDLGGAGLTCATSETAARAGLGMDLDVSQVHLREPGMAAVEVMTSESQERMLAVIVPEDLDAVLQTCARWDVRASVVGRVTEPVGGVGRLRVLDADGTVLADVPAASLSEDAPLYERPLAAPADIAERIADDPGGLAAPADAGADLLALLRDPSWVWQQYDHQLFCNTVEGPGGDAAVLRLAAPGVPGGGGRGLALSTDGNGRWCALDPRRGAAMAVAEAALNVACAGATPAALVNCLNLGNPEHPEVMWQLSEIVDGLAEACRGLSIPVVGGNVSLYNASDGADIDPTPVVGVVGLIGDLGRRPPGLRLVERASLVLLGPRSEELGGSRWAVERRSHRRGRLPRLDLAVHASLVALVAELVVAGLASGAQPGPEVPSVEGIHDVSDGGLAVTLAELAASSGLGMVARGVRGHGELFSEAPSRVVICTREPETLVERASAANLPAFVLGEVGGGRLVVEGLVDLGLEEVVRAWSGALPGAMSAWSPGAA
ncbi:MAG: phosphoribosylformylglycinamidine synthase subunit PurL [Acidimicrobiales bacterium]